ncbi:MAG TPA: ribulose-phosphate 3-epimerase [Acidobacteriota bacterium]|nr:ribulose-phosphate 3-epimerase [Acidobacteriota bacterium]
MERRIAPSILSADFARLADQIAMVESAGADMIHVDVMDGHFVPNITIGPVVVEWIRKTTSLPLDVHLMIENPDAYIESFAKAGANLISVHFEACTHLNRTLQFIHSHSCKAGVVLNPSSPVEWLSDTLPDVDFVLLMSVNPGFGGQKFISRVLRKVQYLRSMRSDLGQQFAIEVDGGIGLNNLKQAFDAGAEWIVAGSAIFQSPDPKDTVRKMKQMAQESHTA